MVKLKTDDETQMMNYILDNKKKLNEYFDTETRIQLEENAILIAKNDGWNAGVAYLNKAFWNHRNDKPIELYIFNSQTKNRRTKTTRKNDRVDDERKIKSFIKENSKEISYSLDSSVRSQVIDRMIILAREEGYERAIEFYYDSIEKYETFDRKEKDYYIEAKHADKVYKAYINDGISRLDKVNGRFLASQTIKLDTIIEQNEKIIELLEKLVEK